MNTTYTNQIVAADALEFLPRIPSASVDLICTDPPYNLGKDYGHSIDLKEWSEYEAFTRAWLVEAFRTLKPTGSMYVFMGTRYIAKLYLILEEMGLLFNGWITWHYTQGMGRKVGFSPRHEDILYFTKSPKYTFNLDPVRIPQKYFRERNNMAGANPGDVWQFSHVHYSNPERQEHPTQKPEALIARILLASSNEHDIVLDPFVGSGTVARVAQVLGRNFIACDLNPDYVQLGKTRLEQPFESFDSVDPRLERRPRDLPEDRKRSEVVVDEPSIFDGH